MSAQIVEAAGGPLGQYTLLLIYTMLPLFACLLVGKITYRAVNATSVAVSLLGISVWAFMATGMNHLVFPGWLFILGPLFFSPVALFLLRHRWSPLA